MDASGRKRAQLAHFVLSCPIKKAFFLISCVFLIFLSLVWLKLPTCRCQHACWLMPRGTTTVSNSSLRSGLTMPLSRRSVGNLSGNELTRNSSGNTRSQSSQLAEPLWTDPGLKSGISVRELISTVKRKKAQAGNGLSNILPKSSHARKKPPLVVSFRSDF